MSPEVTAFSVAVVSPFPPKFIPPPSFTVNGLADAHTASVALPSSVGAAAALATTNVFGGVGASTVVQAAREAAANAMTSLVLVNMVTSLLGGIAGSGVICRRYR
jgi:hypothetical protein